tara:strand:- start:482 stop:1435 length:954 start_codon:yes stop_codon:yes gene_type:complete
MNNYISIKNLSKTYSDSKKNFDALKNINLDIKQGDIFALLGPNGAGKTTLINIVCGIVKKSEGQVIINNLDIEKDYKKARSLIGIVPQELTLEAFETVQNNVNYSRGLYGKSKNDEYIEKLLKQLSLWDKKNNRLRELSGGMKRRVLIAKALSHEPKILFLDEPTASVDVELRIEMWNVIKELKNSGVTIILTTHYIYEAEEIADKVGVMNNGELILVEEKNELIKKMGQKKLIIELQEKIKNIPKKLDNYNLSLNNDGNKLTYIYDTKSKRTGITSLLNEIRNEGFTLKDITTEKSSLESIFINLVKGSNNELSSS